MSSGAEQWQACTALTIVKCEACEALPATTKAEMPPFAIKANKDLPDSAMDQDQSAMVHSIKAGRKKP